MINRDENGVPVSADSISDVTDALKDIEKTMTLIVKKGDKMSEEEKTAALEEIKELEPLMKLISPESQKGANPLELISFLKQVMKIKTLSEKIQGMEND